MTEHRRLDGYPIKHQGRLARQRTRDQRAQATQANLEERDVAPQTMAADLHTYHKGLHLPLLSSRLAQSPHQQDVPDLERPFKRAQRKKHRDSRAQVEDAEKAAQQILPEQPQPGAPPAFPPKASARYPSRSNTYLIIGLQDELTKRGILKNSSDYEDFWKLVQEEALGVDMKEKLQKIKFKLMNPRPWPPAASRRKDTGMLVSTDPDSGACPGAQSLLSRLTEWRKRCQQRESAPRLPQGQGESKITGKMKTDSRGKIYLSCLYQMYSTSLANMEFSRRSKLSDHMRGTAPPGMPTDPRLTAPLTLEHVIQTHPVLEAKTACRYWVNYVDEE